MALAKIAGLSQMQRNSVVIVALLLATFFCTLSPAQSAGRSQINFTNSEQFDRILNQEFRAKRDAVVVILTPHAENRLPPRLKAWLERLMRYGGEVRWRDEGGRTPGIIIILLETVLAVIAEKALDYFLDELLSEPVKNYNTVIAFRGFRHATYILRLEFYRKGSGAWIEAVANSKATR